MLSSESIKSKVRSYIKENFLFGYAEDEITDDMSFLEIGVLDSTGIMELVAFIERDFQIKVLDEEIVSENLDSINSILNFIIKKLK